MINNQNKYILLVSILAFKSKMSISTYKLDKFESVKWWHKQANQGRSEFAVEYYDTKEKMSRLFYPDFIIRTSSTLYILDTKSGNTAQSEQTKDKAKGLFQWIQTEQTSRNFNIIGGIVRESYPNWIINSNEIYVYENENDWRVLQIQ